MTHTNVLLGEMIDTSIREDRVVHTDRTELEPDLFDCCEGDAETETEHEYWGTHDGGEWRIHVARA